MTATARLRRASAALRRHFRRPAHAGQHADPGRVTQAAGAVVHDADEATRQVEQSLSLPVAAYRAVMLNQPG